MSREEKKEKRYAKKKKKKKEGTSSNVLQITRCIYSFIGIVYY